MPIESYDEIEEQENLGADYEVIKIIKLRSLFFFVFIK